MLFDSGRTICGSIRSTRFEDKAVGFGTMSQPTLLVQRCLRGLMVMAALATPVLIGCRPTFTCKVHTLCRCECPICDSRSDAGECATLSLFETTVGPCQDVVADGPDQCPRLASEILDGGSPVCIDDCNFLARAQFASPFGSCRLVQRADNPTLVGADDAQCNLMLDGGR